MTTTIVIHRLVQFIIKDEMQADVFVNMEVEVIQCLNVPHATLCFWIKVQQMHS